MNPQRILIVGHVSLDVIGGEKRVGGPPYYIHNTLKGKGHELTIFTSYGKDFTYEFPANVNVILTPAKKTTTYEFSEGDDESDDRTLRLRSKASQLEFSDFKEKGHYDWVIISGIAGEINIESLLEFTKLGERSILDLQSVTRQFNSNNKVVVNPNIIDVKDLMDNFFLIKGSTGEIDINNIEEITTNILITKGERGGILYTNNDYFDLKIDGDVKPYSQTIGMGDRLIGLIPHYYVDKHSLVVAIEKSMKQLLNL